MGRWVYTLGGLLLWTLHFAGLYAFASLDAVTPADDRAAWQAAASLLSLACAALAAVLLVVAARRLRRPRGEVAALLDQLAAVGAGLAVVAVLWQAASALIV